MKRHPVREYEWTRVDSVRRDPDNPFRCILNGAIASLPVWIVVIVAWILWMMGKV